MRPKYLSRAIIISAIILLSSFSIAKAEDVTLESLIQKGLDNNPGLKASYQEWVAAKERIPQASSLPDPVASYTYFGENVETKVGPQEAKYGFSQSTPFPGKLYQKGKIAKQEAEIARQKYEMEKRELIRSIKSVYYDIFWVDKAILIVDEEKTVLDNLEKVAQRKYQTNLAPQQDVVKAQVEISRLIDKLIMLRQQRKILASKLNALLNQPKDYALGRIFEADTADFKYDFEELHRLAKQYRQDLKVAGLKLKQSKGEQSLAKLDFFPDLSFGFDYIKVGNGTTNLYNDGQDAWMVTVKASLPFWFGKQIAQLKEKNAKFLASKENLSDVENEVEFQVDEVYYKIKTYGDIVSLYETALLPQTEQSFEAARTGYESGKVDFLNWLESERIMLNTRLAYYKSISDYQKSIADLERIVGKDL